MRNENVNKLLFLLSTLFSDVIYLIAFLFLDNGIEFFFFFFHKVVMLVVAVQHVL